MLAVEKERNKMNTENTKTKEAPKTLFGFAWDSVKGFITLNRNQFKVIKSDLETMNEAVTDHGLEPMELDTYIENKFTKLIGTKYKGYNLTGEGGSIRNVTESIQAVHDKLDKFVRSLPDAVVVDGQVYLPDSNGNYKKPVLTFTVRADKNNGMSKDDVQQFINNEIANAKSETETVLTETDNEVINQ